MSLTSSASRRGWQVSFLDCRGARGQTAFRTRFRTRFTTDSLKPYRRFGVIRGNVRESGETDLMVCRFRVPGLPGRSRLVLAHTRLMQDAGPDRTMLWGDGEKASGACERPGKTS